MGAEIGSAAVLETPRLRLTSIREADAGEMAVVLGDVRLHTYIGGRPLAVPELRAQYRRWAAGSGDPGEVWLNWAVRLRETGAAVGTVQATVRRRAGRPATAEIAWVIGLPWQGLGFAAESAAALVAWLTGAGVAEITASIHPRHRTSERVAERAGLRLTSETAGGERVWRLRPAGGRPPGAGQPPAGPDGL